MPTLPPGFILRQDVFPEHQALCTALVAEIDWKPQFFPMYGKDIEARRRIAMFGRDYRYSGRTQHAVPFTARLDAVRQEVERVTGLWFNAILANYYADGRAGIGWHSDADYACAGQPMLASVSLGASRPFEVKEFRGSARWAFDLPGGSVLVFDATDDRLRHRLPERSSVRGERVNLTFRFIDEGAG